MLVFKNAARRYKTALSIVQNINSFKNRRTMVVCTKQIIKKTRECSKSELKKQLEKSLKTIELLQTVIKEKDNFITKFENKILEQSVKIQELKVEVMHLSGSIVNRRTKQFTHENIKSKKQTFQYYVGYQRKILICFLNVFNLIYILYHTQIVQIQVKKLLIMKQLFSALTVSSWTRFKICHFCLKSLIQLYIEFSLVG